MIKKTGVVQLRSLLVFFCCLETILAAAEKRRSVQTDDGDQERNTGTGVNPMFFLSANNPATALMRYCFDLKCMLISPHNITFYCVC